MKRSVGTAATVSNYIMLRAPQRPKWQSRVLASEAQAFFTNLCASGDFAGCFMREVVRKVVFTLFAHFWAKIIWESVCYFAVLLLPTHTCAGGLFYTCFYSIPKGPSINYAANNNVMCECCEFCRLLYQILGMRFSVNVSKTPQDICHLFNKESLIEL